LKNESGIANIDLTGTNFVVDIVQSEFGEYGANANGSIYISPDNKTITLTGNTLVNGKCGGMGPKNYIYLNYQNGTYINTNCNNISKSQCSTTVVCPPDIIICSNGDQIFRKGPDCKFSECPTAPFMKSYLIISAAVCLIIVVFIVSYVVAKVYQKRHMNTFSLELSSIASTRENPTGNSNEKEALEKEGKQDLDDSNDSKKDSSKDSDKDSDVQIEKENSNEKDGKQEQEEDANSSMKVLQQFSSRSKLLIN